MVRSSSRIRGEAAESVASLAKKKARRRDQNPPHGDPHPRCVDYEDRHTVYKGGGWFFCHGCDNADDYFVRNNAWPVNWNSRRFKYTASHKDWSQPDYKKPGYYTLQKSENDDTKPPSTPKPSVPPSCSECTSESVSDKDACPDHSDSSSHYSLDTASCGHQEYLSDESYVSLEDDVCSVSAGAPVQVNNPEKTKIFELETLVATLQQHGDISTRAISSLKNANDELQSVQAESYAKILELQEENDRMRLLLNESVQNVTTQKQKATVAAKNLLLLQEKEKNCVQSYRQMDCKTLIRSVLDEFIKKYQPRTGSKRLGKALAECVWDPTFQGGAAIVSLRRLANQDMRNNFFTAHACARASDLSGGILSNTTFTEMRKIYTLGRNTPNCPIPSASQVKRAKAKLNEAAKFNFDYEVVEGENGEGIVFDEKQYVRGILKGYKLEEKARRVNLEIPLTYDGTILTNKTSATYGGMEVIDRDAINPLTNQPLSAENANSPMHNHIMQMWIGKESKSMIKNDIGRMIRFFDTCSKEKNAINVPFIVDGYKPFDTSIPADMSAHWKGGLKGGAAKVQRHFCNCCPLTSDDIGKENEELCDSCMYLESKYGNEYNIHCFCQDMCDPTLVKKLEEEVECLREQWKLKMDLITSTCGKLKLFRKGRMDRTTKDNSIDFIPEGRTNQATFNSKLKEELIARGFSPNSGGRDMESRRMYLRNLMEKEADVRKLLSKIEHCDTTEALYSIKLAIPCILHLEMRVGIKLIHMIILSGLGNADKEHLDWMNDENFTSTSGNVRMRRFAQKFEQVVNEVILGTEKNPAQWAMHFDGNKEVGQNFCLSQISMTNSGVRALIESIDVLIDLCGFSNEKKNTVKTMRI